MRTRRHAGWLLVAALAVSLAACGPQPAAGPDPTTTPSNASGIDRLVPPTVSPRPSASLPASAPSRTEPAAAVLELRVDCGDLRDGRRAGGQGPPLTDRYGAGLICVDALDGP
ncbi:MAG: hypothetical protein H0V93_06095 [Euzebyales bacterium]|nr:hypothetical protein [Euzebyales bacterium]